MLELIYQILIFFKTHLLSYRMFQNLICILLSIARNQIHYNSYKIQKFDIQYYSNDYLLIYNYFYILDIYLDFRISDNFLYCN